ncbi:LSU ribosomal protein L5p (L11e) [hydrothermal vent metagenome]|uniref:LSU ribosomal protein L5p (L11e) n=1 Tax=hydrothermal vent metagenome TaxID=652676 RepID=A0A3B1DQ82_9ZZZZ
MGSSLQKKYIEEIVPKIKEKFGIKNSMAVPILRKVVVNMGVGKAIGDMKTLDNAVKDLGAITGQKPVIRRSKIAVSNFKLREDLPIGCKVTLRRAKMFEFLDRLVNITLPRIRDFNGVPRTSFDKQGNYSLGLEEQSIFPEIDAGRIAYPQGMDITLVFNKGPKEQTFEILSLLGVPFRKK